MLAAVAHTGGTPLEGLRTRTWLVDYYRLSHTLLNYLGKDFEDLFDDAEAAAAKRMMDAAEKEIRGEVKKAIAAHREAWKSLTSEEWKQRRTAAEAALKSLRSRTWYRASAAGEERECPACASPGWVTGEVVRISEPRAGEDAVSQTFTKLPTGFACEACGLALDGEAEMHAAELGDLFDVEINEDPASFYGIETADDRVEDYYDAYGND